MISNPIHVSGQIGDIQPVGGVLGASTAVHGHLGGNHLIGSSVAVQGPQGPQGEPGPQGEMGPQGPKGDSSTIDGKSLVTSVDSNLPDASGNAVTRVELSQAAYDLIGSPDPNIQYVIRPN